jgi:putative transposase
LAVAVDGANRHDSQLARSTLSTIPIHRPQPRGRNKQHLCLDKAYDSEAIRTLLTEFAFTAHIRSRGEEAKALKSHARKKARRWVVERSHGWLNRFRALLIRWAKRPDVYVAQLHLAFAIITWRAAGLLG